MAQNLRWLILYDLNFVCSLVHDNILVVDDEVSLIVNGNAVNASNRCDTLPGNQTCMSISSNVSALRDDVYGGPTDTWGITLTPADIHNNTGKCCVANIC
jgi:hypothetical protein